MRMRYATFYAYSFGIFDIDTREEKMRSIVVLNKQKCIIEMIYNEALIGIIIFFLASTIECIPLWRLNASTYKKLNKWFIINVKLFCF